MASHYRTLGVEELRKLLGTMVLHAEAGDVVVITRYGRPVARLIPYPTTSEELQTMITTSYGTWTNHVDKFASFHDGIVAAIGEHVTPEVLEKVEEEYRDAIIAALPDGVLLCGDEFIGPANPPTWGDDVPVDEDGRLDLESIVTGVDFWEIVARHVQ